jgi:membrane protease YdiL (CAAX protease family)
VTESAVRATRLVLTAVPDSWSWMKRDALIRLLPFTTVCAAVAVAARPRWIGLSAGDLGVQLGFGLLGAPLLFVAASAVQLRLTRRRRVLSVPVNASDAWFQAGYYVLNGPIEEAFFRGLIQGGLGALTFPFAGFVAGTAAYVLYHRLGWSWPDTLATALLGVPVGLAFWLLPGPPSLLGVAIAHVGATCGFLGLGPYVLRRLGLV